MDNFNFYVVGNIFFIGIGETYDPTVTKKFLQSSNKGVYSSEIWTKEEIFQKWPKAKGCRSILEIKEIYDQK